MQRDHTVRLTTEPGVHSGAAAAGTLVVVSASMAWFGNRVTVRQGDRVIGEIALVGQQPAGSAAGPVRRRWAAAA